MPVPHPTDKSDTDALPDPELNPLLNPLLAAHMGRWAEVYFTNPPEKRVQAVSELLRELENVPHPEPLSVLVGDEGPPREPSTAELPDSSPAKLEPVLTCRVCGYDNAPGQRFCGMCAAPLHVSEAGAPQVGELALDAAASWCEPSVGSDSVDRVIEPGISFAAAERRRNPQEPAWPLTEKNLSHFGEESEAISYRYRAYVGAAVVVLLAVLGYMAWRGTEALSGAAGRESTHAAAIPPAQPAPHALAEPPSGAGSASKSTPPAFPVQKEIRSAIRSHDDQTADPRAPVQIVPAAASSAAAPVAPGQSGAEELAMAEKYLSGRAGMTRDSGQAAQWLWKAVRKSNLEAMLALSDLYLRGDGVAKSCDQARLLLDAAARKGDRAAAERLRNLQAFGCQ
jgi:hypothetical protein